MLMKLTETLVQQGFITYTYINLITLPNMLQLIHQ